MAQTKVPKGPAKALSALHKNVYKLSGGKIGGKLGGETIALLTTTGRKSGKSRTTPLLTKKKGDDYIVVASFSGHDAHPFWYLNLSENPQATITIGKATYEVTAVIAQGDERESLYAEMTDMYSDYAEYQKVTDRVIPVVKLTPA